MKNKFLIIIGSIFIILVALILIFSDKDDKEYLSEITFKQLEEKIDNKENIILYIKQTSCTHCMNFTPVFEKVLNTYKVKAYYINLTNISSEDNTKLSELVDITATPMVYFFEDGELLPTTINGEKTKDVVIGKLKATGYIKE